MKFGKEIDKDFIREAERNGKYFVAYKYGDTINGNIIQSTSLSFSADGKTAEFTTGEALQSGERYYVALIDGENAGVANIIHKYGPAEILEAAKAPSFEVSAVADKIYIDFSEKMKSTALKVEQYEVYDNGGQKLGALADFVTNTDEGAWTNATKKNKVEFMLAPISTPDKKQLRAGETYKIKLTEDLETDSNKKLNKDNTTITVKTPSVKEAAPKAMQARIVETGNKTDDAEVVLVFDKDINLLTTGAQELKHLIQLTYGNKKVNATSIKVDTTHDVANELKLTIEDTEAKDAILDKALTYNVEVPANLVNNAVFPNAANEAIKGIKATAQDNIEIKSLKAQFEADAKVKDQANLILTFDQRPNLESLKAELKTVKFKIKEGTTTYTGTDFSIDDTDVKYYEGDTSGKSIIIEGINSEDFQVFSNKTYTVELDANTVQVDAYDGNGVKNQSKLKATINGVAVTAPVVDKVTLVSEKEIKVEFEEAIDSTIDLNKVKIAGFEADGNKFFSPKILTGKTYLDTSVSGNTLTIKAKKSDAIFETGFSDEALITFEKDAFTTKGTDLSVTALTIDEDSEYKLVDNAAPVLAHAVEVDNTNIQFVFTEALSEIGSNETAIAALFRTGGAADKSSIGTTATLDSDTSLLNVEFKEAWNTQENPVDLLDVTINYAPGQTTFLKDSKGNKVKATKLNGVKAK